MKSWLIEKRIKVIKEDMMTLLSNMAKERRGKPGLSTEAAYYNYIFNKLNEFYKGIKEPKLEVIKAWGAPYSNDHNKMIDEVVKDMRYLSKETKGIDDELKEIHEQVLLEQESYKKKMSDVLNHVENVVARGNKKGDVIVFRDHFGTMKMYNIGGSKNAASISTSEQLLTLRKTSEESFNKYAKVRILEGNGLPGNSKVAHGSGGSIRFEGEVDLRIDPSRILDDNNDTWFEYERFEISENVNRMKEGKGFWYEEGVRWAEVNSEHLWLVVEFMFEKEKIINWVSLLPHIPQARGAIGGTIEKVVIEDAAGDVHGYGFEERFDRQKGFMTGDLGCKRIVLYIRQDVPYQCTVGHPTFVKLPMNSSMNVEKEDIVNGILVHGRYASIENLGVSFDKGEDRIIYPSIEWSDEIIDTTDKKRALFNLGLVAATGESVYSLFELTNAKRYAIGLKDIKISKVEFEEESEYISYPFISSKPIKEISIKGSHKIPSLFEGEGWVEYFISIDRGKTWNKIYDQLSSKNDAKIKYIVNSGSPAESKLEEIGYLETGKEEKEVLVKIVIKRPGGSENSKYSPVVYGYNLEVLI